ncbi:unnamed protein product [Anisakis simplex]|uniref:IBB domain-containing protein n=1 Tax=Anisakis simplex TaxID=6269 RepID=A0A0M3JMJ3_ANISI|nr:unnamed protein product [Anisakis simplex]
MVLSLLTGGIGSWVSPGSSSVAVQSLSEILAEEEKRQCLVKEMRNSLRRRNNEAVKGAKLKQQSEPKNIQSADEKKGGWVKVNL